MKTAVITGASQRLGLYLTENLLEDGWKVYAITRSSSQALDALSTGKFKGNLETKRIGNFDKTSVMGAVKELSNELPKLDLLVNNASIFVNDKTLLADDRICFQDISFVHVELPFVLMQGLNHLLAKTKGNIISITDIYSDNPNPNFSLYCTTKAGLQNLTLSAAKLWAPNVRANCIQPGPIKFLPEHSDAQKESVLDETLLPWEGGFDPIYKTVKFIVENTYVTGQCINVDGGRSLGRG